MTKFLAQRGRPHVCATLFDLDGTLVDSLDVHIELRAALQAGIFSFYLGRDGSFEVEQIATEYERIESLVKLT